MCAKSFYLYSFAVYFVTWCVVQDPPSDGERRARRFWDLHLIRPPHNHKFFLMTTKENNNAAAPVAVDINTKEVLTSDEAARYMGVSLSWLYKLTARQQIPHYKPTGKMCYFNRKELEQWLQRNRIATDAELTRRAQAYCMEKGGAIWGRQYNSLQLCIMPFWANAKAQRYPNM